MDDLISRQSAIDAVGGMLRRKFGIGGDLAEITLAGLPSVQPERKTGRWINKNGNIVSPFWERYECSVCGARSDNYFYCPNCGAYMGGEQDEAD